MTYVKHESISLKLHPEFNEKWVQSLIANDPSILSLGDLVLTCSSTRCPAGSSTRMKMPKPRRPIEGHSSKPRLTFRRAPPSGMSDLSQQVGIYPRGALLKSAKTTDLPIQQSTKVELVINLKRPRCSASLCGLSCSLGSTT